MGFSTSSLSSVCCLLHRLLVAYPNVLPSKGHRAVGKETGKTSYIEIERFNCTLRQQVSRLFRKTLSFSKKLENHIGTIWNFIHHGSPKKVRIDCASRSLSLPFDILSFAGLPHFAWINGATQVIGVTAPGRATVISLRINNEYIVATRGIWAARDWHPP